MRNILFFMGLFGTLAFSGCKTGELLPNQPPVTRLFVSSIELSGDQRLNSAFRLYWTADDADGYVTGFEFSINQAEWVFTTRTDSLFRFNIQSGSDTADIDFRIRAIDNEGLADPDPAQLILPIRNTAPVALFDSVATIPDTVYTVGSFLWSISDLDGFDTVDSLFVRANTGPWVAMPRTLTLLTALAVDPAQTGVQEALLYSGTEDRLLNVRLPGWNVGGTNRLYLRARDLAGIFSPTDSTPAFFVQPKTADLLVIDDHSDVTADTLYRSALQALTPGYDYINLPNHPFNFWDPTFTRLLSLYDAVFWYSDGTERTSLGGLMLLEAAAFPVQRYINNGGKILVTIRFPNRFNDPVTGRSSAMFGFSPMDSLSSSTGQARILAGAKVIPLFGPTDTLECSQIISGADPFYAKNASDDLYRGTITPVSGWTGPSTVCGVSRYINGEINQVFWSVELHRLNRKPQALRNVLRWTFDEAFGWE